MAASEHQPIGPAMSSAGESPQPTPQRQDSESAPTRDQLLREVLGETLSRSREDADGLVLAIRDWKSTLPSPPQGGSAVLDADLFAALVGVVLRQRLGDKADKLPEKLRQEVGDVLWSDPDSRQRIERLWVSVDATS